MPTTAPRNDLPSPRADLVGCQLNSEPRAVRAERWRARPERGSARRCRPHQIALFAAIQADAYSFPRDFAPAPRPHPGQGRRPSVRSRQMRSNAPRRGRRVDQLQPDFRGPHESWRHRPARAPATGPVPRSVRPSNAPPAPRGRRTDVLRPRVLELPQESLREAGAPPTPARHPRPRRAAVGPRRREALPGERGLRCPGHDQVPSCDQSPKRRHQTGAVAGASSTGVWGKRSPSGLDPPQIGSHLSAASRAGTRPSACSTCRCVHIARLAAGDAASPHPMRCAHTSVRADGTPYR